MTFSPDDGARGEAKGSRLVITVHPEGGGEINVWAKFQHNQS